MAVAEHPVVYDDEIDLRELVATLWKRRYLILGVTLGAIGLALIVSLWIVAPVYKSEVRFFLPTFGELGMTPEQYAAYALSDGVIQPLLAVTEPGITPDNLRQRLAAELTTGKTVLSLTATASSADEAHQLATRWLQSFSEAVHAYVSRRVDQALLEAEANLAAVRSGWTSIGEMLHMAPGIQEQPLGIVAAIAYGESYSAIIREYARLRELKDSLADRIEPEILLGPTLPHRPSSPRTLLNAVVAGVLGLMGGIFLAFGLEWWQGAEHRGGSQVA